MTENGNGSDPSIALPLTVQVNESFSRRMLSQRQLDLVQHLEDGAPFQEIAERQPFRLIAWRALMRDFPGRDPASLWMHAYDVEVEVMPVDPYRAQHFDALARLCHYWRLTPSEVEELADEMIDAMIRLMLREAAAIEARARKR